MSFLTTKKLYPRIYKFIYLIYIQKIGILFLSSYEKSENDLSKFGYFHMEHPMPKEIEANPWLFIGRQLNYFLETILISNLSFMHTNGKFRFNLMVYNQYLNKVRFLLK